MAFEYKSSRSDCVYIFVAVCIDVRLGLYKLLIWIAVAIIFVLLKGSGIWPTNSLLLFMLLRN